VNYAIQKLTVDEFDLDLLKLSQEAPNKEIVPVFI
jgi:hypothetical protein